MEYLASKLGADKSPIALLIRSLAFVLQCVAVCCSVLQCVAVCCSVLQCVTDETPPVSVVLSLQCMTHDP